MMSVLEAAKANAQSKQLTIWREIRARLSATQSNHNGCHPIIDVASVDCIAC